MKVKYFCSSWRGIRDGDVGDNTWSVAFQLLINVIITKAALGRPANLFFNVTISSRLITLMTASRLRLR